MKISSLWLLALFQLFVLVARAQTILTNQHVDLSINYNTSSNQWQLTSRDENNHREYAANLAVYDVPPATITAIPSNPSFSFLGMAGSRVWILTASQNINWLYLGVSTENKTADPAWVGFGVPASLLVRGFSSGTFQGSQVTLKLVSLTGPGNFSMYDVDGFGTPHAYFNSGDGITTGDVKNFASGIHAHFNYAFSAPGVYQVALQASGNLSGSGTLTQSAVTTFTFNVRELNSQDVPLLPPWGVAVLALLVVAAGVKFLPASTVTQSS